MDVRLNVSLLHGHVGDIVLGIAPEGVRIEAVEYFFSRVTGNIQEIIYVLELGNPSEWRYLELGVRNNGEVGRIRLTNVVPTEEPLWTKYSHLMNTRSLLSVPPRILYEGAEYELVAVDHTHQQTHDGKAFTHKDNKALVFLRVEEGIPRPEWYSVLTLANWGDLPNDWGLFMGVQIADTAGIALAYPGKMRFPPSFFNPDPLQ